MTIDTTAAVTLAVEQSSEHQALASEATGHDEKCAHETTMRALDKAAMEMARGNMPVKATDTEWLINSRVGAGVVYRADLRLMTCNCKAGGKCWHYAAASVCDEVLTREANDGDLLPQGARNLLAEHDAGDWCATETDNERDYLTPDQRAVINALGELADAL